jgi:uncharacterized protein (UPF0332 family)
MVFDWANYLVLSRELSLRGGDEAALRSAISRAYYSTYHQARLRLKRNGKTPIPDATLGIHQRHWETYRQSSDVKCQQIGVKGDRLRETRNRADYDDIVSNVIKEAQSALLVATGIIGSLNSLPPTLP